MTKYINEMEFLIDFSWVHANIYNSHMVGVRLIGFYTGENPAGLAIVKQHETHLEIAGIFVKDEKDEDVFLCCYNELIESISDLLKTLNLSVSYTFSTENKYFERVDSLLKRKGFVRDTDKRLVLCLADGTTKDKWYSFLNLRGNSIVSRLERKGYVNIAYKDLTSRQREYIHEATEREFKRVTSPRQIRMPLDNENSFFTFNREELLVAYCTVFRLSFTQLLMDFIGAKEEYRNSGVFLMPLIAFITNTFTYEEIQSISYFYHVENREMESLSSGWLMPTVVHSEKTIAFYYLSVS